MQRSEPSGRISLEPPVDAETLQVVCCVGIAALMQRFWSCRRDDGLVVVQRVEAGVRPPAGAMRRSDRQACPAMRPA
ncbi:hypothetical protein BM536_036220 [Streptomyces phaeoluteigriseus]|uniref:Uncharacterized protein n=1 Tax=Streptomyces phaeoluteigriseus TaxID=114686 RepID=A0A1V6MI62_9ACTN|nr:hypothetical protein BM536_036220 [Streptomyces phaeoluteigriseus]